MAQFKPNVGAAKPTANAPSANVDAVTTKPVKPAPRKLVKAAVPNAGVPNAGVPNASAPKIVLPKLPAKAAPLVVPAELKAAIAKANPEAQPAPAPMLAMPPVAPEAPLVAAAPAPAAAVESAPEPVAEVPEPAQPDFIAPAPVEAEATSNEPIIDSQNQTLPKETDMATEFNAIPSDTMTTAVSDVQAKLQTAYDKSAGMVAEMSELAKGNVEAIVESTKLFAAGVQDLSKSYAEEAKSAYETATADIKEMSAIKSPTELFQLQGKILRRNFENLIAATSKSTDAALKLANEAMAPISGRVNVATEKLSKIAA